MSLKSSTSDCRNQSIELLQSTLCAALLFAFSFGAAQATDTTIRVGIYENPPKIFHSKHGRPTGFFVDILDAIAQKEHWKLNYVSCEWERCLTMLEQGEIDLMPDVAYSKARDKHFDFHREVVLSNWSVLYAPDTEQLRSLMDLEGKRIAVIADSIQYHILTQQVNDLHINPHFIELESSAATLKAVAEGSADAALVNRLYGIQNRQRYNLHTTPIVVESSLLYYATAENRHGGLLRTIDLNLIQQKSDTQSAYYKAMYRWIEPADRKQAPVWLIWGIEALALIVIFLIIISLTLKHLVKRKTAEMQTQNQSLRQSEAMFHTMFHTSQDAMLLADGETLLDCNPAMLQMFRYPDVETMRALRRDDLFPPQQSHGQRSSELAREKIQSAYEKGSAHFEWIHRRADGTTFPSEVTLVPMEVNNRKILQATIRDITQRKRDELSLLQLNRALQTLSRVNHILIHSHDERTFLASICRAIVEEGGYRLAWIGMAQHDDISSVKPVSQYGFEGGYLESLKISWGNNEYGQGPTGIAIRTGNHSVVRDINRDPKYTPWREQAKEHDFASSIALPLSDKGTVFGALNIYSGYPDAFSEDEVALLKQLADEIVFGITNHRMKLDQTDLEEERKGHKERLQNALLQTIQAITVMVEKRDPFTAGHQRRVADLAVNISETLELDPVQIEGIHFGAMIHDIGNIYVPAEILNRPGKLTDSELRIVKSHPQVGYEIVKGIDFPWPVASMILYHQERIDGSGYPEGIRGDAIPLEARIIAVADVVEAMLSHRPYRASHTLDETLQHIKEQRGIKYDDQVVDACIHLFREKAYTLPV